MAILDKYKEQLLAHLVSDETLFFEIHEKIDLRLFSGHDQELFKALSDQLLSGKELNTVELANSTKHAEIILTRIQDLLIKIDYRTDITTILQAIDQEQKKTQIKQFSIDLQTAIRANQDEPDLVLNEINSFLSNYGTKETPVLDSMDDHVNHVLDIAKRNMTEKGLTGVPTGLSALNRKTNGFQGGDLVVIAGETSMGKTALALSICSVAADHTSVLFFTLEMTANQLTSRLMAMESGYNSSRILASKMSESELLELSSRSVNVRGKQLWIEKDTDIDKIIVSIRKTKSLYKTRIVVIDYLQLITSRSQGNKEQKTAEIARRLKNLAIEIDIPVILISQLNRDSNNPFPRLSRLRDSGQIEEAADIVIFVYRPEYYGKDQFADHSPAIGRAQIIVAKGRNIGTGSFYTEFDSNTTKFSDD